MGAVNDRDQIHRDEILRLHRRWVAADDGLLVRHLAEVMAGEHAHHFGLDGRTYRGLAEIVKRWEGLVGLVRVGPQRDLRVQVRGDGGWVSSEAELLLTGPGAGHAVLPMRITAVFARDDGHGHAIWSMWHLHCSQARRQL